MDVSAMTLAQKCGQVMMIGFDGTEMSEDIKTMIRDYHIGNIILFDKNFKSSEQLFTLLKQLQEYSLTVNGIPLFIAVDQEGGMVTRLSRDVTFFPGAMAVSASAEPEGAYAISKAMGEELFNLGINMNLAPVCDINNNPQNPVINVRSYGDNPQKVAEHAVECIRGLQEENVIAVAKHFPGHGDTVVDSHTGLPVIAHDKQRIQEFELVPFKKAIASGVKAVLSAHIIFPAYEKDDLPATLSKNILTGLLREELGFKGLILTDCMEMAAISAKYGTAKATPIAILAGADIVMVSHNKDVQIESYQSLMKQLDEGAISHEYLDAKVERIIAEKENLLKNPVWEMSFNEAKQHIFTEEHLELARSISEKSITASIEDGFLPLTCKFLPIVFSPKDPLSGVDSARLKVDLPAAINECFDIEPLVFSINPTESDTERALAMVEPYDKIVIFTYNASQSPSQAKLIKLLSEQGKNVLLCAMRSPYDIDTLKDIKNYATAYECTPLSVESMLRLLKGQIKGEGQLPLQF